VLTVLIVLRVMLSNNVGSLGNIEQDDDEGVSSSLQEMGECHSYGPVDVAAAFSAFVRTNLIVDEATGTHTV